MELVRTLNFTNLSTSHLYFWFFFVRKTFNTIFRKCMIFHSENVFFDRFTQMDAEFVIFGWVGWLAGLAALGWVGWLGWAGLVWARPKPQKTHEKKKKNDDSSNAKKKLEILRNSIFVDPAKIRILHYRPIIS